jgi:hypothetical protein
MTDFSVVMYTHNAISDAILNASIMSVLQQAHPRQIYISTHRKIEHPFLREAKQIPYIAAREAPYNVNIYCQAMSAMELAPDGPVFLWEHDVLYPHTHYQRCLEHLKPGFVNYATNIWMLNAIGFWSYSPMRVQSMAYGMKVDMLSAFQRKLFAVNDTHSSAEPIFDVGVNDSEFTPQYHNLHEALDIRHRSNTTQTGTQRKAQRIIQEIPYWGRAKDLIERLQLQETHNLFHHDNPPNE